jgi:hypothetical protein
VSVPTRPEPVKLFFAVLSAPDAPVEELERRIDMEFGEIDRRLPDFKFTQTDYYEREMGPNLKKHFVSCAPLISPGDLVSTKLHTNRIEQFFAAEAGGGRPLNIDPGYLDFSRVVLATGKDASHRIYVGRGIYAETTLIFGKSQGYEPQPWTYLDWRHPEVLGFFSAQRELLRSQRKSKT